MDFRTLRYVVAIEENQSITKAARSLYVGQPTLSKFLIALEEELGLKLFRRLGQRYVPTYAGERYVERARKILKLGEDLDAEMNEGFLCGLLQALGAGMSTDNPEAPVSRADLADLFVQLTQAQE
jgi:DNA-binding transcriptional LysR family regulator